MGRGAKYFEQLELRSRKMYPTGVGSGDSTLLDTSQTTLRNFSFPSAVWSSAIGFISSDGFAKPFAKKKNNHNLEDQEKYFRSCQREEPAESNPHNTYTTQRLPATGEDPSVATAGRETLQGGSLALSPLRFGLPVFTMFWALCCFYVEKSSFVLRMVVWRREAHNRCSLFQFLAHFDENALAIKCVIKQ